LCYLTYLAVAVFVMVAAPREADCMSITIASQIVR